MTSSASNLHVFGAQSHAPSNSHQTLVIARVGERHFAIPASAVERVLRMAAFAAMPGLPAGVAGLLNLHGATLPVIDARALFQQPATPPQADQHLIVLDDREPRVLWVDAIDHVPNVPSTMVHELPGNAADGPIEAVVHLGPDVVPLLAVNRVLPGGLARRGETAR